MVTFRRGFSGANAVRLLRSQGGFLGVLKRLSVAASFLLLTVANAQAGANIDTAITDFQTEGVRLVGVVSVAGIAIIAAGVLMTLGWAMLRKVSGGK